MKKVEMSTLVSFLCLLMILFKTHGQEHIAMFTLCLTWPNGFCLEPNNDCYTPPPQDFTIHGFWPQRSDGTSDEHCAPESPLSRNEVDAVKGWLSGHWPSLIQNENSQHKANSRFWKEQWAKHGTCSNMEPQPYFRAAVSLKKQINLLDALARQGIKPGYKTWTPLAIKSAIERETSYVPHLVCLHTQKGTVVKEIRFCVNPTTPQEAKHKFTSCPRRQSTNCNGDQNFITFFPEERSRGQRNEL